MMDIVKIDKKDLYEEFSNVVLIYQNKVKEAHQIEVKYNFTFGSLEIKKFKISIEIIKLKKSISYIITQRNKGKKVSAIELDNYIEKEMKEYEYELEDLLAKVKYSRSFTMISLEEERKCKQLFYKIAKLIHPDLHPEYEYNDEISELWNLAKMYYDICNLEEIEKIYDAVVVKTNDNKVKIEILNIEEKIKEYKSKIELIEKTKPYILEEYLTNEFIIYQHKEEIDKEINNLNEYKEELKNDVSMYLNGGINYVQ